MKTIYEQVAERCSFFTQRMSFLKNAPETSGPTCMNCRFFKNNFCTKEVFDVIRENL